jgi:hypothetical protein
MNLAPRRSTRMQPNESRILIIAHRAAEDAALLRAVAERAAGTPAYFTLLVPAVAHGLHRVVDPEDQSCAEAEATLEAVIPALSRAAGGPITGMIGSHDPFAAALDALNSGAYDEVIVSGRTGRLSRWLRLDLPRRIAALGIPVVAVESDGGRRPPAAVLGAAA